MDLKYCIGCKREVVPRKHFSWLAFILWTVLTGIGGIGYIVYFLGFKKPTCPSCGGSAFVPIVKNYQ